MDCEGRGLPEVSQILGRPQWRSERLGPGRVAEVKVFPEYMLWEGEKRKNSGRKVRGTGQGPTDTGAWNPGPRATPAASPSGEDGHEGKSDRTPSRFPRASLSLRSTSCVYSFPFSSVLSFRSPFTVTSSILLLTILLPPFWPTLHIFARLSLLPCVFPFFASLFHLFLSVPRMFYILAKKCIQRIFCCHLPASGSYYRICEPPAF